MERNPASPLLEAAEPPAAYVENATGTSPVVLCCEHASNRLPARLRTLGVGAETLASHIAWDPGALSVARAISNAIDAPLVRQRYSRLVVDCNRQLHASDLIVEGNGRIEVPGNMGLSPAERQARIDGVHTPYHKALTSVIDNSIAALGLAFVVSIHSFVPAYNGEPRPWQLGVCYAPGDRFARALLAGLRRIAAGWVVGDNQPYYFEPDADYTLKVHCVDRALPGALIEVRQDVIATREAQRRLGTTIGACLAGLVSKPAAYGSGSRGRHEWR